MWRSMNTGLVTQSDLLTNINIYWSGNIGVGNIGKVTSFFDSEADADIAGPLVRMLSAANIPDWLRAAAERDFEDDEDWG